MARLPFTLAYQRQRIEATCMHKQINSKTILLVERHIINRTHRLFGEIDDLAFRSKNLYNLANYHMRQEFFRSSEVLSYSALDKLLQITEAYQALAAKVSQQVLIQVSRDWKSFIAADYSYKQD